MAVLLTISNTLGGAEVSDALQGGGTGIDMGTCVNGSYAPVIDKSANTGSKDLYITHNAVTDEIFDFKVFMQQFGVGTGFAYGGSKSAAQDFTDLKNQGHASGSSKNNADGNSSGLWCDMDWDVSTALQFDKVSRAALVKIFGDNGPADGIDLPSAFLLKKESVAYNNVGVLQAPSVPVDGKIGKSGDTVLGDTCLLRFRNYLKTSWPDGGYVQGEIVFVYSFSS